MNVLQLFCESVQGQIDQIPWTQDEPHLNYPYKKFQVKLVETNQFWSHKIVLESRNYIKGNRNEVGTFELGNFNLIDSSVIDMFKSCIRAAAQSSWIVRVNREVWIEIVDKKMEISVPVGTV